MDNLSSIPFYTYRKVTNFIILIIYLSFIFFILVVPARIELAFSDSESDVFSVIRKDNIYILHMLRYDEVIETRIFTLEKVHFIFKLNPWRDWKELNHSQDPNDAFKSKGTVLPVKLQSQWLSR